MFPIIAGKKHEKDLSEVLELTELERRKPHLYQLHEILNSAMGIYSLPILVLEHILMPYLRISPIKDQAFSRMLLWEANVDLGFWGPVLLEDGHPFAWYYEIINDSYTATVIEDQWNVLVSDFSNSLLRSHLEEINTDRSELLLDNNKNITKLDPVVIFRKLRHLDAHQTKIHDLSPLGELARRAPLLRELNLSYTLISDLEPLRGFVSLQFLNISQCINVEHLEPISGMSMLQFLHMDGTRVSCLESVPLVSLRYLNAAHTRICDLSPLANSQICDLSLMGCKRIPPSGFSVLSSLNLVELSLSETSLISQHLERWPSWSELTRLWLDDCPNISTPPSLRRMWKLKEISISNSVLNSLEPLRSINLRKLCLNDCTFPSLSPVSGLDIEEILLSGARFKLGPLNFPKLNALDISHTKTRCILILNSLRDSPIVRLDLSHTSIVNLWSIRSFSGTLRQLDLSFTPVHNISPLSTCRFLETLNLSYTKIKGQEGMYKIAGHLFSLLRIYLEGTPLKPLESSFLDTSSRAGIAHAENGANPEEQEDHGENEVEAEEENHEDDDDAGHGHANNPEDDDDAGHGHENNPEDDEVDLIEVADNTFINIGID